MDFFSHCNKIIGPSPIILFTDLKVRNKISYLALVSKCYIYIIYNNGHWFNIHYVPTTVWLLTSRCGRQAKFVMISAVNLSKSI